MPTYFASVGIALMAAMLAGYYVWRKRDKTNVVTDLKSVAVNTFSALLAFSLALVGLAIQDGFTSRAAGEKDRSDFVTKSAIYMKDIERELGTMNEARKISFELYKYCGKKDQVDMDMLQKRYQVVVQFLENVKAYSGRNAHTVKDFGPVLLKFPDASVVATYHLAGYVDALADHINNTNARLINFYDRLLFNAIIVTNLDIQVDKYKEFLCTHNTSAGEVILDRIKAIGGIFINICVMSSIARNDALGDKTFLSRLDKINGKEFNFDESSNFKLENGKTCSDFLKKNDRINSNS